MGSGSSKEIAARLRQNGNTKVINLEGKLLDNQAIDVLVEALRDPHIRSSVRCLRLGGCGLDGYHLQRIAEALVIANEPTRLRRLELTMHNNSQIANPIGEVGAKALAMIISRSRPYLQHVVAAGCGIGDVGVKCIAHSLTNNGHLLTLDLSNNSIGEKGAEELGKALEVNYHLKGLLLWKNRIFHTGAEALVEGLMGNSTLESLGLGCNHIGDAGAQAFAQLLLSEQSRLKWLALGANNISLQGAKYLAVGLKSYGPRALRQAARALQGYAHHHSPPPPRLPRQTSAASSLSSRSFVLEEEEGNLDDEELSSISSSEEVTFCCSLESLGLGGNSIRDEGIEDIALALASNTTLTSIGLGDNRIGNQGAKALADLIRSTSTLNTVILSGNSIRDEGASQLIASLSQNGSLKKLFLANNPFGDSVIERCLEVMGRYNQTLEELDIHGTHVTREKLEALVLGLKESGVVRMLGSERLPASLKGNAPVSGNMMELASAVRRDSTYHRASMKKTGIFSEQPFRQPMTAFLTSLPAPEETAQSLVMKERQRRSSISKMFKRKFSKPFRKGEVADITEMDQQLEGYPNMAATLQPAVQLRGAAKGRKVKSPTSGAYEMKPLVEEQAEERQNSERTSVLGPPPRASILQASTVVLGEGEDGSESDGSSLEEDGEEDDMPPSPSDSLRKYSFTGPAKSNSPVPIARYIRRRTSLNEAMPPEPPIDVEVELSRPFLPTSYEEDEDSAARPPLPEFDIPRAPSLDSLTRDRIRPPSGRRRPTSPSSLMSSLSSRHSDRSDGLSEEPRKTLRNGSLDRWKGAELLVQEPISDEPVHKKPHQRQRQDSRNTDDTNTSSDDDGGDGDSEGEGEEDVDAAKLAPFRQSIMSVSSDVGISKILSKSIPILNSMDPELTAGTQLDEKSLKDQWILALSMRVGIVKMGGFLHSVFDGIERSSRSLQQDFTAASLPVNKDKNRPQAPFPPGHSRVKMNFSSEMLGSEYINASYVGPPGKDRMFMVAQAPLENTIGDFWRLVWEQGVRNIVMLTQEFEKGQKLSERYWPESDFDETHSLVVSDCYVDDCLSVSLVAEEVSGLLRGVVTRTLLLTNSLDRTTREVKHYQCLNWPQSGVLSSPEELAPLVITLEQERRKARAIPIIVHSSLGTGRAGCFVAVSIAKTMVQSEVEPLTWDSDSNILDQVIRGIRTMRPGLVENSQQFEFCHQMLEQVMWGKFAKEFANPPGAAETKKKWWKFGKKKEVDKNPPKPKKEKKNKKAVSRERPVDRRKLVKNLDDHEFLY